MSKSGWQTPTIKTAIKSGWQTPTIKTAIKSGWWQMPPFFNQEDNNLLGVVLKVNNNDYYVPVSSPKPKHHRMSDGVDFIKIFDSKSGKLLCILNLNNMIPVPRKCITLLRDDNVDRFRSFKNMQEKNDYILLLHNELAAINKKKDKICNGASKLYNICSSNLFSPIKMRCCDFETLEVVCKGWEGLYEENINQ